MKPIQELYEKFDAPATAVITMHQKPDADAMGSALALNHFLKKLGFQVTTISPTNWAAWLNWMPGRKQVLNYERDTEKANLILEEATYLFCLDFNIFHRTKRLEPKLAEIQCTKVLVDHHREPDEGAFDYGISDFTKSSTCEMVYDIIVGSGKSDLIDMDIAACLYAGVIADTGSFKFSSTTPSVHFMAADLLNRGLDAEAVHSHLFDNYLENRLRFIGHVLTHRLDFFYEYNTALIAVPRQDLKKFEIKTGDTEGVVNIPQTVQDIKLVGMVVDREGERKWSFRSKGDFDCNAFARKYFNGGGHFNAAGGSSEESIEEAIESFKKALKDNEQLLQ